MGIPQIVPAAQDVPYLNVLVYADSGAGKTVLCGSDKRVLFLAPEDSGTLSAVRMGSKADKIRINSWKDMKEAYDYLYDNPEILDNYDWVAVDSLTELQKFCMLDILKGQRTERINKGQDPDQPQIQDYGKMHILFENLVRGLNDLEVNVIYTALARKVEDADKNEFLVPEISGKDYGVAMKIVALMTSYGYLRTEVNEVPDPTEEDPKRIKLVKSRMIYWEDTGTIRGKDRTTRLTPYTRNMTLEHIRHVAMGNLVRSADGRAARPKTAEPKKTAPKIQPVENKVAETAKAESDAIVASVEAQAEAVKAEKQEKLLVDETAEARAEAAESDTQEINERQEEIANKTQELDMESETIEA